MAKDETMKAYKELIKQIEQSGQNASCRFCQQRFSFITSCESVPVEGTEPRHYPSTRSQAKTNASDDIEITIHPAAAEDLTAQSTFLDDDAPNFPLASLSPESILSDSGGSSAVTHMSPFVTSRDTQPSPASTFGQLSQECTSQHASATRSDLPQGSTHGRRSSSLEFCPKQQTSSNPHRGDLLETSPRRDAIRRGRRCSSPASSDVSMHSSSESAEGSDVALEIEPDEQSSSSSSDSRKACSNKASEMSSGSRSLESRAFHNVTVARKQNVTTVTSSARLRPDPVTPAVPTPAAARQICDQPTDCGQEETDSDLKTAIRESYEKFALDGQRLTFCCEPLTLDPTAINLNTNWKQRSKLNRSLVERLLKMGSEIFTFLPEADIERASKKETELIRRLCPCKRPITASNSLKEIVRSLRWERDVTKDELNLIEFDLYSTLIVMRCQSEDQASFPFQSLNDMINKFSRSSSRRRSQLLVITNAIFLECTTVCTYFLQV